MHVYAGMDPRLPIRDIAAHAQRIERLGYLIWCLQSPLGI